MGDKIKISGISIGPGERKLVNLRIARLPTHTDIDLPVHVIRGQKPGPVLLLTAGLHGDEVNGIEIVRRMISGNLLRPVAGTILAMPIVNVYGFLQNARYLPDGKDLNRSFPGSKQGSLARRVAWNLMNHVVPLADVGVDFHTGGASLHNHPHIRCVMSIPRNRELAKAFAPGCVLNAKMIDKSFRKAAHKIGKHIIVFEGGESLRFHEESIQAGMAGTLRLMRYLNMISELPELTGSESRSIGEAVPGTGNLPSEGMDKAMTSPATGTGTGNGTGTGTGNGNPVTHFFSGSSWIRARFSGLYRGSVNAGDWIKKGQLLGSITDPFGESEYKVTAPSTGFVVSVNRMPVVNMGDAIIHVARKSGGVTAGE
ncbi:MAG: succinylglutamate desuccinylase/aspartoacylase family protein [Cyclonatronaceae bacterium]